VGPRSPWNAARDSLTRRPHRPASRAARSMQRCAADQFEGRPLVSWPTVDGIPGAARLAGTTGLGAVATDGSIYISGDGLFTANSAFLVKFTAAGSVVWQREWGLVGRNGVAGETTGNGVAAAPAGGAYVVGDTTSAGADPNLLAVRFDSAGNFVWQVVGGPGFGSAQDVAVGPDGNVHVTGNVLTDGGDSGANQTDGRSAGNGDRRRPDDERSGR